jgi:hypothetical protein
VESDGTKKIKQEELIETVESESYDDMTNELPNYDSTVTIQ